MNTHILSPNNDFPDDSSVFKNGALLLVDKVQGWTSFDVVNKLRWHLCQKLGVNKLKMGHAGTLDPLATGLLVLCVGDYTRRTGSFQAEEKEYIGTITFGATTPSFDLEKAPDAFFHTDHLTDALIAETVQTQFTGEIFQVPPMFSAIKIDGKRVYKNARTGEVLALEPRSIEIRTFEVSPLRRVVRVATPSVVRLNRKGAPIFLHPEYTDGLQIDFRVVCSKGTYIRSLAHDLGAAMGTGAYLSALRRTRSGDFTVEMASSIEDFLQWMQ